jgi:hypothetical protein
MNKPVALAEVERIVGNGLICWLDSDTILTDEPSSLVLRSEHDFAACCTGKDVASAGPGDPSEAYWAELSALLGVDLDSMPWLVTVRTQERIRFHFNSGVFVFRAGLGFSQDYLGCNEKVLRHRVAHPTAGLHFTDQVVLGMTVLRCGFRWGQLPFSHNHTMGSFIGRPSNVEPLSRAAIVHYHDSMSRREWTRFLMEMEGSHSAVFKWLEPMSAITGLPFGPRRAIASCLRITRYFRRRLSVLRCSSVHIRDPLSRKGAIP